MLGRKLHGSIVMFCFNLMLHPCECFCLSFKLAETPLNVMLAKLIHAMTGSIEATDRRIFISVCRQIFHLRIGH